MDLPYYLQNDREWLRLKGEHDSALGRWTGLRFIDADLAHDLSMPSLSASAREAVERVRDRLVREVHTLWQIVEGRRAAWHLHQDKGPEGRRYCTCGCKGAR